MNTERTELCDFLEDLMAGAFTPDEARTRINDIPSLRNADLEQVYSNLFHYIDDADIRDRDAGYKELQDSEMKKLIQHLKTGDLTMAQRVTFLKRT